MAVKTVWDVTHACGHDQTHDLSAKRICERDAWLARERHEDEATVEASEALSFMPALDGSDQGVEWARRVRHRLLNLAHDALALSDERFACDVEISARAVVSASWWIDQRDSDPADLVELLADAWASKPALSIGNL